MLDNYLQHHTAAAANLPGQDVEWLREQRQAAMQRLRDTGLPGVHQENWRYTDTRSLTRDVFAAVEAPGEVGVIDTAIEGITARHIRFVDGHLVHADPMPEGVSIKPLAEAVAEDSDWLAERLGSVLPNDTHGFNALAALYSSDGAVIRIAANSDVSMPLQLDFIASSAGDGKMAMPRLLIIAEAGCRAQLIERHLSAGDGKEFFNGIGEIIVEDNARLDHWKLQEQADSASHLGAWFADVAGGAQYRTTNVTFGARLTRNDLQIVLSGESAHAQLDGLYIGRKLQHIDNFTRVEHAVPQCTSDELFKGVMAERSRAVFHGRIVVQPDAQQTNAYQNNRNLLLSREARVDTKPQLEIYADDVKCSHGATIGQMNAEQLFYLRARGVPLAEARRLLIHAFVGDVLARIDNDAIRTYVEAELTRRLEGAA
ncbi:Fe-S cluster assembly protein SufD [Gammaproteobacteria bacterium]|nr:Fe-S cluster assembly protein SufD [Gammaproteobacteria bacterium]